MNQYPLIFKLKHSVACGRFSAVIVGEGRVLMSRAEDGWWCHGVQPGSLTTSGETPEIAYKRFRESLGWYFEDVASETQTYESFESRALAFMGAEDADEKSAWFAAVQSWRTNQTSVESAFAHLVTRPANAELSVRVERVEVFADEGVELAKAA